MQQVKFKLDKTSPELMKYTYGISERIDNIDEMYQKTQGFYTAVSSEISAVFEGWLVREGCDETQEPWPKYDIINVKPGQKVGNGTNCTNIKPTLDEFISRHGEKLDYVLCIWHNHQAQNSFSKPDILLLIEYGEYVIEAFLDTGNIIVLSISPEGRKYIKESNLRAKQKIKLMLDKFYDKISEKYSYTDILENANYSKADKARLIDERREKINSEFLDDLIKSGMFKINTTHFEKVVI